MGCEIGRADRVTFIQDHVEAAVLLLGPVSVAPMAMGDLHHRLRR